MKASQNASVQQPWHVLAQEQWKQRLQQLQQLRQQQGLPALVMHQSAYLGQHPWKVYQSGPVLTLPSSVQQHNRLAL
jgi:hypothetical protein